MKSAIANNLIKIINKPFATAAQNLPHQMKYFRISPATRYLMLQLGYTENDLPKDKMVVNKYALQEAIKKGLKKAPSAELKKESKQTSFQSPNATMDIKISENAKLNFNKNFIPQSYYNETVSIDNLISYVNAINARSNSKISIEDFVARAISVLINKNANLRKIYDPNSNKFINYDSEINVYLESNTKLDSNSYILRNPHKYNLADANKIKFNLKDYKESYIPMVRIYNYSELNVNFIDQVLTPPALFSLTLGKIFNDIQIDEETNKFSHCKKMNLRLTATPSAFDENEVVELLTNLGKFLNNPLTISL